VSKIVAVRACAVSIPLDTPTGFATRTVSERHYGLVEIEGDDGVSGIGFCYVGHKGGKLFVEAVHGLLAPVLVGEDTHRVEGLWEVMYQEALLQGRAGTVMRGISAVDIALWDRNARAAGLPLYKFLGASKIDRVPAYASGGYYLPGKTPKMLGEECARYVAQGFKAVKIKVGRLSEPKEEEARIAAARKAVGPDTILMLDANNAWTDLPTALRFARVYERYNPYWLEEPFGPDDIDNHARLTSTTSIPIATGEIAQGRWHFKELLMREAVAMLQPDACVMGGITEFRRVAATAASFGVTVHPHWFHDLHAHLVAATPNARFVEYFPDDQVLNFRRLLDTQLELDRGDILLPDRPGLGFEFSPEAVKRYTIERWRVAGAVSVPPPPPARKVRTRPRAVRRTSAARRGRR
jgi:L-alanine-DL-glutamate epimerase-like enolase superfamily enzyme